MSGRESAPRRRFDKTRLALLIAGSPHAVPAPAAGDARAGEYAISTPEAEHSEVARLEAALREAEARARLLFDSHPIPLWVYDRETLRFLAVNDTAVERYGYTRDELLAMTIADIRPPEDVPRLMDSVARAPEGPEHAGLWRHLRKDGSVVEVEITSHTLAYQGRPAKLVMAMDVAERARLERERRRSQAELAQSEASLRTIVDNAVFGMYRSTADGRFTMVNRTLVEMLGYASVEELLEANISRDIYREPRVRDRLIADAGPIDLHDVEEVEWKRKDGSPIAVRLSGHTVRDERGDVVAYEMIVEDATERLVLEEQLRQAQKMEAVGLLAGGLAHDFNNLLSTVLATSEMLRADRAGDAALDEELRHIVEASQRGAEMIRQLLVFSRQQRLELQTVELSTLAADGALMLRRLVPESIEIRLALDSGPTTVRADPGAVQQIVMNLVTNARDAMPQGGVVLVQTFRQVLDAPYTAARGDSAPGDYVVLAVSDTGVGMDADTLRRVFEPFFTTKPVGLGTGLGLSTVYGLAKQHRGFATVYSEPGRGTSVKVYFPTAAADRRDASAVVGAPARGGSETILLAEDEDALRHATRRVLEKHGYRVLAARDGVEALDVYTAHAAEIDLVLTDVVMPRLGGPQLVERLRAQGCAVPVLFTSGYTARDIAQGVPDTMDAPLLLKPWTIADLTGRVRAVLDRKD